MNKINNPSFFPASLYRFLLGCLMALLVSGTVYAGDGTDLPESGTSPTPYEEHGRLSISGSNLVDENGEIFQIRGVSTSGLAWYPEYVSEDTFRTLRDNWNVNTIRLAMYTADSGGYCVTDDAGRETLKQLVLSGVQAAGNLGMYVIIDWHILSDNDPNMNKDMALSFFGEMSSLLNGCGNVIYEICNEPNSGVTWDSVRTYSLDVIDTIRSQAPDSVIIVGTPTWSQDVDAAAASPIERDNLLYSLHFYANTHRDELRQKAIDAIEAGLPLIVSEFGISDASGSGEINTEEGDLWLSMLDHYQIGYVIWNLSNKDESSALLRPETTALCDWSRDELSASAQWFISRMTGEQPVPAYTADSDYPSDTTDTVGSGSGDIWVLANSCTVTVSVMNTWSDGSSQWAEYDVNIANPTASPINTWRLRLTWGADILSFDQYWNCDIGGSGSSFLFVPKDFNTVINSGSSVSFGFICASAAQPALINVVLE